MYRDIIKEYASKYSKCPYLGIKGLRVRSMLYPNGEKSFWEFERYSRLEELRKSMLGERWINSGCPDIIGIPDFLTVVGNSLADIIDKIVEFRAILNPSPPQTEISKIKQDLAVKEVDVFFRYYLEYRAIDIIINQNRVKNVYSNPNQLQTNLTSTQLDKLFDLLIVGGFIPEDTNKDGFKWAFGSINEDYATFSIEWNNNKANNLCAYLIDCLMGESNVNFWHIGEGIFNIKGLRQMKNNYLGNKCGNGKPKGYLEIDKIILSLK